MNNIQDFVNVLKDIMPYVFIIFVPLYIIFLVVDYCILTKKEKELENKEKTKD